jgi:hypothetical protein
MTAAQAQQVAELVARVRHWPSEMKRNLAQQVLETLPSVEIREPPRRGEVMDLFGILKTAAPPPSDEECERILEEERLKKYG